MKHCYDDDCPFFQEIEYSVGETSDEHSADISMDDGMLLRVSSDPIQDFFNTEKKVCS